VACLYGEDLLALAFGQYVGTAGLYSPRRLVIRIIGCKALTRARATVQHNAAMHALAGKRHHRWRLRLVCILWHCERCNSLAASTGVSLLYPVLWQHLMLCRLNMSWVAHMLRRHDQCAMPRVDKRMKVLKEATRKLRKILKQDHRLNCMTIHAYTTRGPSLWQPGRVLPCAAEEHRRRQSRVCRLLRLLLLALGRTLTVLLPLMLVPGAAAALPAVASNSCERLINAYSHRPNAASQRP